MAQHIRVIHGHTAARVAGVAEGAGAHLAAMLERKQNYLAQLKCSSGWYKRQVFFMLPTMA